MKKNFSLLLKSVLLSILVGLPVFSMEISAQQAVYYVSPSGNDGNNGLSTAAPFATLTKARDVIRTVKGTMTGDIIVNVMAGDYNVPATMSFTNVDGGNNGFNVIYKNYDAIGSARFIGGSKVSGWSVYSGKIYRVNIGANQNIYTLYENGIRADMARYPKKTSARAVSRGGYMSYTATPSGTEFIVLDNGNYNINGKPWDPAGKDLSNAWLYGWMGTDYHRWTAGCTKIVSATGNSIKTVSSGGLGWPWDHMLVENSLQLLEWPGEYYYDKASGYLYYYSRSNGPIENQEIIAPKIVRMVSVVGASLTSKVQNIQFVGLCFMGTDRPAQATAADWGCTEPAAYEAAIYMTNVKRIKIQNCRIAATGVNAITMDVNTDTTTVTGCLLEHVGYTGILTRTPCTANIISNSIIRYIGEIRGHGVGIGLTGGENENTLISHMNIYFTARSAVGCGSGGNTIEYISMHDNIQDSGDQGAIYLVGCPYDKPNKINQCVVRSTYSDFSQWDRGPTGFYNDRNAPGTTWSNCDAGDRVATGAGDHQWWSFRHDVQDGALPILFKNCSWDITYNQNYQYSRTPNASFSEALMEYSKIGVTSEFPVEYNDLASKPTTPVGLWIQKGNTEAKLHWTQADRATSYTIKRSTVSGGPYTAVGTENVPARGYYLGTEFLNTGLTNGSTYYYVVTASNAAGESDASVERSVAPDLTGSNALTGTPIGTVALKNNAFDGNLTSVSGSAGWVGLDLGKPMVITGLEYTPTNVDGGSIMNGGVFQGSNDPTFATSRNLFTIVATKLGSLTTMRIPQAVFNEEAFRYVRFYRGTNDATVAELKFFGHVGDGLVPVISGESNVTGRINVAMNYAVTAEHLPTSFASKDLPAGLSLNANTGVITGVPTVKGTFSSSIIANNAYGSDTVVVALRIMQTTTGGLVAHYAFDQDVLDSSPNEWNAVAKNGASYLTGKKGSAINLDGIDDHVTLPEGIMANVNQMTISAWINPNALNTWSRIFDFGTGTAAYMFLAANDGSGRLKFAIKKGGVEQSITSTIAISTGSWVHVAVTLADSKGSLYINGALVGTNAAMTIKPSDLGSTAYNYVGRSQFSTDPYFKGLIDDFRFFSRALASDEIMTLSSGGIIGAAEVDPFIIIDQGKAVGTNSMAAPQGSTVKLYAEPNAPSVKLTDSKRIYKWIVGGDTLKIDTLTYHLDAFGVKVSDLNDTINVNVTGSNVECTLQFLRIASNGALTTTELHYNIPVYEINDLIPSGEGYYYIVDPVSKKYLNNTDAVFTNYDAANEIAFQWKFRKLASTYGNRYYISSKANSTKHLADDGTLTTTTNYSKFSFNLMHRSTNENLYAVQQSASSTGKTLAIDRALLKLIVSSEVGIGSFPFQIVSVDSLNTGISMPSVNAEKPAFVNVYDLSGRCIRKNISASNAVEGLEKGFYIIGRKKVMIKY